MVGHPAAWGVHTLNKPRGSCTHAKIFSLLPLLLSRPGRVDILTGCYSHREVPVHANQRKRVGGPSSFTTDPRQKHNSGVFISSHATNNEASAQRGSSAPPGNKQLSRANKKKWPIVPGQPTLLVVWPQHSRAGIGCVDSCEKQSN